MLLTGDHRRCGIRLESYTEPQVAWDSMPSPSAIVTDATEFSLHVPGQTASRLTETTTSGLGWCYGRARLENHGSWANCDQCPLNCTEAFRVQAMANDINAVAPTVPLGRVPNQWRSSRIAGAVPLARYRNEHQHNIPDSTNRQLASDCGKRVH
jgi:hypothetical protein